MAKLLPKKIDLRKAMHITTLLVLVGCLVLVGIAALFMMDTLNAVSTTSTDLTQNNVKIDTIDTAKLNTIQQRLDKKTTLDAPREGQLQNPFVTPTHTTAPAPAPTPVAPTPQPPPTALPAPSTGSAPPSS